MNLSEFFSHPFVWGLALGLLFFGLSLYAHFKTKLSLNRYRKMLSDKLEIEAEATLNARKERDALKVENENLRTRVTQLSEKAEGKLQRELEILARAEKAMMISAPGFAPAWENAKTQAATDVSEEDKGKALPKRIFRRFFGNGKSDVEAIEMHSEPSEPEEAKS
jgi:hypothetical protein